MRLSIIGYGNIAHWLITSLKGTNINIHQVLIRNGKASSMDDIQVIQDLSELDPNIDALMLAVPDHACTTIANQLGQHQFVLIHHSGTLTTSLFETNNAHACIWPVYSIVKNNLPTNKQVPLVLQCNNETSKDLIQQIANQLSNTTQWLSNEQKAATHLAATIGNNFTNQLFAEVYAICEQHQIDFNLLTELLKNTTNRLGVLDPANYQTGPALRRDELTINKHLDLLKHDAALQQIYQAITNRIQAKHQ